MLVTTKEGQHNSAESDRFTNTSSSSGSRPYLPSAWTPRLPCDSRVFTWWWRNKFGNQFGYKTSATTYFVRRAEREFTGVGGMWECVSRSAWLGSYITLCYTTVGRHVADEENSCCLCLTHKLLFNCKSYRLAFYKSDISVKVCPHGRVWFMYTHASARISYTLKYVILFACTWLSLYPAFKRYYVYNSRIICIQI